MSSEKTKKLVKNPKTPAMKAGLPSDMDKAKEIAKVISKETGVNVKVVPPRKKRELTEEAKEALRERLVKARAARASKRSAQVQEE
jgi:RNase H-fold protein (predicted Holliday junction resolvase)